MTRIEGIKEKLSMFQNSIKKQEEAISKGIRKISKSQYKLIKETDKYHTFIGQLNLHDPEIEKIIDELNAI